MLPKFGKIQAVYKSADVSDFATFGCPFADFVRGATPLPKLPSWMDAMKSLLVISSSFLFLILFSGCNSKPAGPVEIQEHTKACLATSDKADGKVDKVIGKCPACALAMNGDSKHKASIDGYEVHSCSSDCNKALQEDPNKIFKDMKCDAQVTPNEGEVSPQK